MTVNKSRHGVPRVREPRTDREVSTAEAAADERSRVEQLPYDPTDNGDAWMAHAVCSADDSVDPEDFFPVDGSTLAAQFAILLCSICPVMQSCRERRHETGAIGVWAGVYYSANTNGDRQCKQRGCSLPRQSQQNGFCGFEHEHATKVGTKLGYQLHQRAKVPPCPACKEGRFAGVQKYDRTGGSKSVGSGGSKAYRGPRIGARVAG